VQINDKRETNLCGIVRDFRRERARQSGGELLVLPKSVAGLRGEVCGDLRGRRVCRVRLEMVENSHGCCRRFPF
jgi:hypothetical protein